MSTRPAHVDVREVGPRDGLQNEAPVPIDQRVRLIDALSETGLRFIEAASFVSPTAIPPRRCGSDSLTPGELYSEISPT